MMCEYLFFRLKNIAPNIFVLLVLFMQLPAIAQVNKPSYKDTIFRKFANTSASGYVKTNPYYISVWENEIPSSIKIIRRLDDKVAIIELSNPTAFRCA
jgi:hypothetical protein